MTTDLLWLASVDRLEVSIHLLALFSLKTVGMPCNGSKKYFCNSRQLPMDQIYLIIYILANMGYVSQSLRTYYANSWFIDEHKLIEKKLPNDITVTLFGMGDTWDHVSMHWQQGNYQLWANCFMCWNPISIAGLNVSRQPDQPLLCRMS